MNGKGSLSRCLRGITEPPGLAHLLWRLLTRLSGRDRLLVINSPACLLQRPTFQKTSPPGQAHRRFVVRRFPCIFPTPSSPHHQEPGMGPPRGPARWTFVKLC